jgi:hypothetical protein
MIATGQQRHHRLQTRTEGSSGDAGGNLNTGLEATFWARQGMQTILDNLSHHRRNLSDLVSMWFWVFA